MSSSEYMTESENANEFIDANVAPDVDIENVIENQLEAIPADGGNPLPIVNVESPSANSPNN